MSETQEVKSVKEIEAGLVALGSELKAGLTRLSEEQKANGQASEKTGAAVEEMSAKYAALQTELSTLTEKLVAEGKRLDEMAANNGRPGAPGEEAKSVSRMFVESEAYKRFKGSQSRSTDPVSFKTLLDTSAATRLTVPQRDSLVAPSRRVLRLRDLIPVRPTSQASGEYIEETGFNAGTTQAVTSITQTGGLATITTTAAHGWGEVGQYVFITVSGAVQDDYNGSHYAKIASTTTATFSVDSGATSPATGTILAYKRQTHGAAAAVAEGSAKPEARIQFELKTWNARVVAHWLPATRQVLDDDAQLQAYIEDRMLYGLEFAEETQILYGDGSSPNLQGILTHTGVPEYIWSDGPTTPVPDTKIDAIRRAMTLAMLSNYPVTGLVINPLDKQDIDLAKGDDGHYIAFMTVDNAGVERFFRVPIVETPSILSGEALVGAFAQGATLWDREQASIRIAEQHSTYFTENKLAILAEERVGLAIYRPEAFVKVTFDAEPS